MNVKNQGLGIDGVVSAWLAATPQRRAAAMAALQGANEGKPDQDVIRWGKLAKRMGVSTRTARYAAGAAGIKTVKLPGRSRAIGIRAHDLAALIGEG